MIHYYWLVLVNYYLLYIIDYYLFSINIIYYLITTLYSINKINLNAFISIILINIGITVLLIGFKALIVITLIVGNIIDIYIWGLIGSLINYFMFYS